MTALDCTFQALADPTRRAILARLAVGQATVGELAAPFDISLPAVSRHLKVLETAELISNVREGKHRRIALRPEALDRAAAWLDFSRRFWRGSFERLDEHLKRRANEEGQKP
jgi:DNA-binding transcriptional ArsR family regulator